MRLWQWLARRTVPQEECAPRRTENSDDVLRDRRHERELRDHRERLQQLSDELSLIQRDEGRRA